MLKKIIFFLLISLIALPAACFAADNETLILYFSKTGKTRIVADEVKKQLPDAGFEEITSDVGFMALIFWHQPFGRNAVIEPIKADLSNYSKIILCSPTWLQKLSSPARTALKTLPLQGKQLQAIISYGGHFGDNGKKRIEKITAEQGISLYTISVVKTGGKSEDEIRQQVRDILHTDTHKAKAAKTSQQFSP
ncbi:MAG: hypothetical protein GY868_19565 [Deltaproteobacteria bacterium]|nr:hypothetical protein [Deltaproteobacteria bacterium]